MIKTRFDLHVPLSVPDYSVQPTALKYAWARTGEHLQERKFHMASNAKNFDI